MSRRARWTIALTGAALMTAAPFAQTTPGSARSAPLPIVLVTGCANPTGLPQVWQLSRAGATREATRPGITSADERAARADTLGQRSYDLIGVADFVDADASRRIGVRGAMLSRSEVNATGALAPGHRVAVKGVLIPGAPQRINLTSVVDLAATCP
jgi:hypothetical protein